MTFRAHQGFVLFRRVTEITGVFCRDHALEAYFAARGVTLKGMWFSPSSLVFGTLRSLYDSAKLLDLPDEVKDEPWVHHIVACPNCRHKNVAAAGPEKCDNCESVFIVASCASCNAVHVLGNTESIADIALTCRLCGRKTKGPEAVRNWAVLLIARAFAEASAVVATANGDAGSAEKKAFLTGISSIFEFDEKTTAWVGSYFDKCTEGKAENLLQSLREGCTDEYKTLALRVALSVVEADGIVDDSDTRALCSLAELIGLDPNWVYEEIKRGRTVAGTGEPWWDILCVSSDATLNDIEVAYRELAKRLHPDLWMSAPEKQKVMASARMASINLAFECAKKEIHLRETRRAAAAAEIARKAAAEAEAARRAEERRRAEAEARAQAQARAARQEEEDRKAAAKAKTSKPTSATTEEYRGDKKTPEHQLPNRQRLFTYSLGASLASMAIILFGGYIIRVLQTQDVTVSEKPVTDSHQDTPLSAHADQADARELEDKRIAVWEEGTAAEMRAAAEKGVDEKGGGTSANEEKVCFQTWASRYNTFKVRAKFHGVQDGKAKLEKEGGAVITVPLSKLSEADQQMLQDVLPMAMEASVPGQAANTYIEQGIFDCKSGKLERAIFYLNQAIRVKPDNARVYFNRGIVWTMLGEYDIAIRDFNRTIAIDPYYPRVYAHRDLAIQKKRNGEQP